MTIHTVREVLREHSFFKGLESKYLELLEGCARNTHFDKDSYIFREGENADNFYILRHGTVSLEVFAPQRGSLGIQTLHGGDVLGWSWIVPPYKWQFDAKAIDTVRAIALDGKCLRGKCEQDHDLGYELMKRFSIVMGQRLQAARMQLLDLYGGPA